MSSINIGKQHPATYNQMVDLNITAENAAIESGLDPKLIELVKIRVLQINGCAFCLRMHTRDALAASETSDRLAVLPAWPKSQYVTAQEQAALIIAEETITLAPSTHTDVDKSALNDAQGSAITWLAVLMNSWNRIALRSEYPGSA